MKALLTRGMVTGNPGGVRNDQLEMLQIEMETMRIQMTGQTGGPDGSHSKPGLRARGVKGSHQQTAPGWM